MQKIKDRLICFDLDGVLINSMGPAIRVFKETMERELGLVYDFSGDKKMWALSPREKMDFLWSEEIKRRGVTKEQINRAMDIYQKGKLEAHIPVLPHAKEAVALMASRFENIAVVSSNANFMIAEALRRIGILPYIKKITGTDDVMASKPDPAIYLKTVEYFGVKPECALTFEDSTFGIMAGKAAGMHVIGVATGVETFGEIQKTEADYLVRNLSEVSLLLVERIINSANP